MHVLETERLAIFRMSEADAPFILDLLNQPSFLQYIGDKGVRTLDDARNYITSGPQDSYQRYGYGLYVVALKEDGTRIGICGVMKKDWLSHPDLGYAFLPEHTAKGFALEAARAVLRHEMTRHALGRVLAVVTPDNAGSIRLLEKLGFVYETMASAAPDRAPLLLFAAGAAAIETVQNPLQSVS